MDAHGSLIYRYARLLIAAMVPPMLHNGIAFEAHPQNTLVRIAAPSPIDGSLHTTPRVIGFVIRDLGGIRVHPPTLNASISSSSSDPADSFEFLPGHCIVTSTVQEAAKKLYHTLIHNQLQRLIRVLGLHYDGRGWEIVRKEVERNVGRETWLWKAWMDDGTGENQVKSMQGKCLLRMKIQGLYRDVSLVLHSLQHMPAAADENTLNCSLQSVYEDFPNLIQFRPGGDNEISHHATQ